MAKSTALATIRKEAKRLQASNKRLSYQDALKAAGKKYKAKNGKKKASAGPKSKPGTKVKTVTSTSKTVTVGKPTRKVKPASHDIRIAKKKLQTEIGDLYGRLVTTPQKGKAKVRNRLKKQIMEKRSALSKLKTIVK